ncbi:hypothetical protein AK95_25515 [Paenibacillus sp. LC231]|uniref:hypothetical protein n=1 Tax=Paenibacillus sp. LC231 TaxID=1120679 RepID=UPI0008DCDFAC|nr:hypothetical protein [Paenibacillus sp. LC231]OIB00538.1 hypothetical protein AK95_25515 [Paenibacillus sp. LC231]
MGIRRAADFDPKLIVSHSARVKRVDGQADFGTDDTIEKETKRSRTMKVPASYSCFGKPTLSNPSHTADSHPTY